MKEDSYTSLICANFCNYYKPGKDREKCGGYFYIKQFITPAELGDLIEVFKLKSYEASYRNCSFVCEKCDFRVDGCDFFVNKSPNPCGGYLLINRIFHYTNF
ncbi:MAG: hypothetical protein NZ826_04440 [Thermodesulfovibrio sp.]|nr:hypothetical protein [Thermodesulfovibrio sp.]MDW7973081.1 hypothetical protein [Thermodesulfovibrio sp.]